MPNLFDTRDIDLDDYTELMTQGRRSGHCVDSQAVQTAAVEGLVEVMMPEILDLEVGDHVVGYIRDEEYIVNLNYTRGLVASTVREEVCYAGFQLHLKGVTKHHLRRINISETFSISHEELVSPTSGDHGWKLTVTRRA